MADEMFEARCNSASSIYHLPSTIVDFPGGIAQLVERQLCKLEVRGSNPLASKAAGVKAKSNKRETLLDALAVA
jgi:hypothetical protein